VLAAVWWRRCYVGGGCALLVTSYFLLVESADGVPMARPHLICLAVCPEGPAPVAAGTHTEIAESHQPLLAPRIVMEGDGPWVLR
jgi:hypothetical protein